MSKKQQFRGCDITINTEKSFKERLRDVFDEYSYLILAAGIPAFLFFLMYLTRGLYPFGNGTVLVLDLNGQYVYFFEALKKTVLEGGSLLYSWSRSLGGEFLGMYAYYLASPFSYLICLFPDGKTQEFLLVLFMIKAALCGGTMGFFLHKHSEKRNKLTVIAFSILYAVSAYCVVHQNNTMWMDAVMWLPLVAYGIECVVKYGKFKLFVIMLALTLASNFYIGYMVCIFVMLYFFYYMYAYKDNNANNPWSEKAHYLKSFLRIGFFSLLAIMMAAVIVMGAYYSLQFGKNEFTDPSWDFALRLDIFDIMFKMLPSSYDTVRIDGLPFVYCGLLTVLLAPLFFLSKKFTFREKAATSIFLLIFVLSFSISVFDLIWHGFQKPQWLNNRYSFMFCFLLIFIAFRAFESIEEFSLRSIAGISALIMFFVILVQNFEEDYIAKLEALNYGPEAGRFEIHGFATVILTILALTAYLLIIGAMRRVKNKDLVSAVLVGVVCLEVFLSGISNLDDFDEDVAFTKYYKYNDFQKLMVPVADTLQDYDKGFYRSEITTRRKDNDNFALGLKGITSTTSTLNSDTISFIHGLGYFGSSHRTRYEGGSIVNDSLIGLKYIISARDYSDIYGAPVLSLEDYAKYASMSTDKFLKETSSEEYKHISADKLNIYQNPYALSLAFASGNGIYSINFKDHNTWVEKDDKRYNKGGYLSPFDRINALYTAILGEEETVEIFKPATQEGSPLLSAGVTAAESSGHYRYSGSKGSTITYTYTVPEGVEIFAYFPAFYSRAIKLSSPTLQIFDGTTSLSNCNDRIVHLGYTKGKSYRLTVTIDNTVSGGQFYTAVKDSYIYYVDMELFEEVIERIKREELVIDEEYKDDDISGTITTLTDNRTILTTIPYDEGWKVYVDGKEVDTKAAVGSALLSFEIDEAGKHDIRFLYRPAVATVGIIITGSAIVIFALLVVFESKIKGLWIMQRVFFVEEPKKEENNDSQKKKNNKKSI